MQCVRTVNMPCSSAVVKSLDGFSYAFHFPFRVDHYSLCKDKHHTLYHTSRPTYRYAGKMSKRKISKWKNIEKEKYRRGKISKRKNVERKNIEGEKYRK